MKVKALIRKDRTDELISAHLDGELPRWRQRRLARQVAASERSRAVHAELATVKKLLREKIQASTVPDEFWAGVHARIVAEGRNLAPQKASWSPYRPPWLAPSMVVAGAAVVVLVVAHSLRPRENQTFSPSNVTMVAGTVPIHALLDGHAYHAHNTCIPAREFADPDLAAAWLQRQVGFALTVPDLAQAGLALVRVGPCICLTRAKDKPAALYTCQTAAGKRISIYELSPQVLRWDGGEDKLLEERPCRVMRHDCVSAIAREHNRRLFGVAGELGETDLLGMTERLLPDQRCPQQD